MTVAVLQVIYYIYTEQSKDVPSQIRNITKIKTHLTSSTALTEIKGPFLKQAYIM